MQALVERSCSAAAASFEADGMELRMRRLQAWMKRKSLKAPILFGRMPESIGMKPSALKNTAGNEELCFSIWGKTTGAHPWARVL